MEPNCISLCNGLTVTQQHILFLLVLDKPLKTDLQLCKNKGKAYFEVFLKSLYTIDKVSDL